MPFTILGVILGIIFLILGMRRKQKSLTIIGIILLVLVFVYWGAFLIHHHSSAIESSLPKIPFARTST